MSNTISALTTVIFVLGVTSCSGGGGVSGEDAGTGGQWTAPGQSGSGGETGGGYSDCGNGMIDLGEQCDGANLGGESCSSLGEGTGEIRCTAECAFDVGMCTGIAATGGYGG
jgi:hypothetical protein